MKYVVDNITKSSVISINPIFQTYNLFSCVLIFRLIFHLYFTLITVDEIYFISKILKDIFIEIF